MILILIITFSRDASIHLVFFLGMFSLAVPSARARSRLVLLEPTARVDTYHSERYVLSPPSTSEWSLCQSACHIFIGQ